ncbi:MAG: alpha-L-fucosidase [Fimbriimonadales bacterium]|nr:alpha-L-fucosidase [Fimbriimonadales bacterium]
MGLLSALLCSALTASTQLDEPLLPNPNTGETEAEFAARTAWWREAKFGMFIHWGVYAVPADGEWHLNSHRMQVADYEKYAPRFNPVRYDAERWVRLAKAAGMRYIVITSKHHDGFALWPTKQSDWSIAGRTPFRRDPLKELAEACRKHGITLGFYHSIMDWHHPDYLPRRPWETQTRPAAGADLDRYIDFMKAQLTELLTQYGRIGVLWFDGGWEHSADELRAKEVVAMIRRLQPWILINDRINLPEDHATPEQHIPAGAMPGGRLWETCMTMNDNWGYHRQDNNWKSTQDLVRKLCDIASKGGNFLLNVGPTELGEIPQPSVERLEQIGRWMRVNGAAIYGTTKSPLGRLPFEGRVTRKGRTLYVHAFEWPEDGRFVLPGVQTAPSKARLLGSRVRVQAAGVATEAGPATVLRVASKPKPAAGLEGLPLVIEVEYAAPIQVARIVPPLSVDAQGRASLLASDAVLKGTRAFLETIDGVPNVGGWLDLGDTVEWTVRVPKTEIYRVELEYACPPDQAGGTFEVSTDDGQRLGGTTGNTGSWRRFDTLALAGTLTLRQGERTIRVRPLRFRGNALMNLRRVTLVPAP